MEIKVILNNPNNNHTVEWQLDEVFFHRIVNYFNHLFLDQCQYKLNWLREQKINDLNNSVPF